MMFVTWSSVIIIYLYRDLKFVLTYCCMGYGSMHNAFKLFFVKSLNVCVFSELKLGKTGYPIPEPELSGTRNIGYT